MYFALWALYILFILLNSRTLFHQTGTEKVHEGFTKQRERFKWRDANRRICMTGLYTFM